MRTDYAFHVHGNTPIADVLVLHARLDVNKEKPELPPLCEGHKLPLGAIQLWHIQHASVKDELDSMNTIISKPLQAKIVNVPLHATIASAGIYPESILTYSILRRRTGKSLIFLDQTISSTEPEKAIRQLNLELARTWNSPRQDPPAVIVGLCPLCGCSSLTRLAGLRDRVGSTASTDFEMGDQCPAKGARDQPNNYNVSNCSSRTACRNACSCASTRFRCSE